MHHDRLSGQNPSIRPGLHLFAFLGLCQAAAADGRNAGKITEKIKAPRPEGFPGKGDPDKKGHRSAGPNDLSLAILVQKKLQVTDPSKLANQILTEMKESGELTLLRRKGFNEYQLTKGA